MKVVVEREDCMKVVAEREDYMHQGGCRSMIQFGKALSTEWLKRHRLNGNLNG